MVTITKHALDRYIARHRSGLTRAAAKLELLRAMSAATKVREGGRAGTWWQIHGGIRLVAVQHGQETRIVTVLA